MLLKTMVFGWLSYCSRQNLYKAAIYSCYKEYKSCFDEVKRKDNNYHSYMDTTAWEKMNSETKELIREKSRKQSEIVDEMVAIVKLYCKQYPDEKICHHCNFKTYDEYPYRLPQSITEFINLL
jgi:adenylate kinase